MHPPSATYRIQFNAQFTFEDARALVAYLSELGISDLYGSPFFLAPPGSTHGYDISNHNEVNPEVGPREALNQLSGELRRHSMGLLLDWVPNHMGIAGGANPWWNDVLENGPSSIYAGFFDIDWYPLKRELENKVLLPILGDQYGRVLESGQLSLEFEAGAFFLKYFGLRLPLAPRSWRPLLKEVLETVPDCAELASIITALEHLPLKTETDPQKTAERAREKEVIKGRLARLCEDEPALESTLRRVLAAVEAGGPAHSFEALDSLLNAQCYRLANWRVAAEEINYRRFFDINTLAALRMECPEVFAAAHKLVFELLATGVVTGLRIDHVDGLWHPRAYLEKLQQQARTFCADPRQKCPLFVTVEKILGHGERLRGDWPVHGTTGYDFVNEVTAVLVDPRAERAFSGIYAWFTGAKLAYADIVYESKKLITRVAMASEVNTLGHLLNRISESNRWYRDFTLNSLTTAIREVIACFPVYRTYLVPGEPPGEEDIRMVYRAIAAARRRNPALERTVFEFLRDVLVPPADNAHPVNEEERRQFVARFQQCTGPITAKGVEDTSFYRYNRLLALNEVGGDPALFGSSLENFHAANARRLEQFPHSLLATSTHDTKRSEDVRARIAALSELPQQWSRALRQWSAFNRPHRQQIDGEWAPDRNEEYLLYQTLLGTWPLEPMDSAQHAAYVGRITEYMLKALHEAKVHSSWIEPNLPWDQAVVGFVEKILSTQGPNPFLGSFVELAGKVARLGAINSLTQTVLKFTCPGIPDVYQGQELWDLSLVDPDNRRAVDYAQCQSLLQSLREPTPPAALLENWHDGRIKLLIIQKLARLRREQPALFTAGRYSPIPVSGTHSRHCIAFARELAGQRIVVVVPRLSSRVGWPATALQWGDTLLHTGPAHRWRELFTGRTVTCTKHLPVCDALLELPVAVLVQDQRA